MRAHPQPNTLRAQRGAVALLLVVILAISTATFFLVRELNANQLQLQRDKINAAALAQAKDAVLGFALVNQDMPGGLPYPDRNGESPPNYDGNGDCVTSNFQSAHLLGKFPFLNEEGCGTNRAFDIEPRDAGGERLWYAASKKLVKSNGGHFPATNTTQLMDNDDWLTVRDESGAVLSDRVAFILIAPSEVLSGQNRSAAAPTIRNYLDNFTIGATTYRNWDDDLDFISARPANDGANRFNDRLLYVTRDEFVNRLVERIAGEIRSQLDGYHIAHDEYPFAANNSNGMCHHGTASGYMPIRNDSHHCDGALAFLAWWENHKWQDVTHYNRMNNNQAAFSFDSCGSVFTVTWNTATGRSEMQRSAPC